WRRLRHDGHELFRRPGDQQQRRRFGNGSRVRAQERRPGNPRSGDEAQTGAIHAGDSHGQSDQSSARRLHDRETDCEGTGGAEGLERSAGAAGHPPAIARSPRAVIESGVLREPPRRRQSHELLCGTGAEERGSSEVGRPSAAKTIPPLVETGLAPSKETRQAASLREIRRHYPSSFFVKTSFTNCGLAWPFEAFMTWPTKNPIMVFLPARDCSTCLGFAAINSSASFSSADVSRDCSGRPCSS